jgi:5'-nucleotidase
LTLIFIGVKFENMKKPTIFVTNDDGIEAPGIRKLIDIVKPMGNVVVVAPDRHRSGTGHSITIDYPLRIKKLAESVHYKEYACNGLPVDCVKIGEKVVMGAKPDLLVSGINHGSNAMVNVIYSGTMAAVIEGCMSQIPSIGFSLDSHAFDADFDAAKAYIEKIIRMGLEQKLPGNSCLNVNIPAIPKEDIKGIKICRQGLGYWDESYEMRTDPRQTDYYWLKGKYVSLDGDMDTDEWALRNGYIAVVPVQFDLTHYKAMEALRGLNGNE